MKKPLALLLVVLMVMGCASPPKRLSTEETRFFSSAFELGKRYDNLLALLEQELSAIEEERKFYQEHKSDKTYSGDLEGTLFILDDIAEIYTIGLVDFQKAFETNTKALQIYNEIQKIGLQNLPDSPYFNPRRRLYYHFYLSRSPAKLVDNTQRTGKEALGVEQVATQLRAKVDSLEPEVPYVTPFPKEYLAFVRQMDLERIKSRIDMRFGVLHKKLGMHSPQVPQPQGGSGITGSVTAQEFTVMREVMEKSGIYNAYYLNFYLAGKAWALRSEWGKEAYHHVVYFGRRAFEQAVVHRQPDDYESLAFLRYWVGMAELKRGNLKEGLEQLEQLVGTIEINDRVLNEKAKALADEVSSLKTQRIVGGIALTILALPLANYGGGGVLSAIWRFNEGFTEFLTYRSAYALRLNRLLDQEDQLEYFYELGRAYEQLSALDKAVDHYKEAIAIIEQQRATIAAESQRISFLADRQAPYKRIVPLLLRLRRAADALEYVERARSRALVDLLGSGELVLATPEETEAYRQFVRRQSEIDAILSPRAVSTAQVQYIPTRAAELKTTGREPRLEIRSLANVTAATASEIQQLVGQRAALVEYFFGDSDLAVFLIQDGTVEARLLPLNREALFQRLKTFRDQVEQGGLPSDPGTSPAGPSRAGSDTLSLAQELYRMLFAPIAGKLTKPRLYVVPHGPLHYIPFQALHDGERFMVERFTISYLPSATVLKFLKEKSGQPSGTVGPLVLANPDLGDPKYDLPSADREATLIRDFYPAAQVYARNDATKRRAKDLAGTYGLLHFATHGSFAVENPLEAALILAKGDELDGRLTAREIFGLRLHANLVVLSACNTGLTKVSTGDELVGLSRAFMTAGSTNLVASLWEVADDSTALLMGEFYKNLKTMPKAEALRQAQLTLMRSEIPLSGVRGIQVSPTQAGGTIRASHPYFWAPFILIGAGE
ncbi:MAG: CHAT domain-containing protein [candidate division NC10 bacterium]|nr:CHAT domain-containing protein [candidate division NC10 bacterium]